MLVVSMWYSREDAPSRAGYFYCFNGIGASLGGIFTYAIGQMNNFPVYKGIFLVCGGLTLVWGVLMLVFFPKNVLFSKRFTVEEKAMVVGIGKRNQTVRTCTNVIRDDFMDLSNSKPGCLQSPY